MANLQRRHAGFLGVAILQARDQATAFVAQHAQFVQLRRVAWGDEAAVAGGNRQLRRQRAAQAGDQLFVLPKRL